MRAALALCAFALLVATASALRFSEVSSSIARHQSTADGGFHERGASSTLDATSDAVVLATLFGVDDVNYGSLPSFIQSLANSDGSFSDAAGEKGSVAATRDAVVALSALGVPVRNVNEIGNYLSSLVDKSGLVSGNIHDTLAALEVNKLLNNVKLDSAKIAKYLKEHIKSTDAGSHFSFDANANTLSDNRAGLEVAKLIDFQLPSAASFVSFLTSRVAFAGGFFDDASKSSVSLESSIDGAASLALLGASNKLDVVSLKRVFDSHDLSISDASEAHLAVASVDFGANFHVQTGYLTLSPPIVRNKQIVAGSKLRPAISARTSDGLSADNFDVTLELTADGEKTTHQLQWAPLERAFVASNYIDFKDNYGEVTFTFRFVSLAKGLFQPTFEYSETLRVGYSMTVRAIARHDVTNTEIPPGGPVSAGTEFSFVLSLKKLDESGQEQVVSSGDFELLFQVVDSSGVKVHEEAIDGNKHNGILSFMYALRYQALPQGELRFFFKVVTKADGVHTQYEVVYNFQVPLVAGNIRYAKTDSIVAPSLRLGQRGTVSMQPGNLIDLRSFEHLSGTDVDGKEVAAERQFFLDLQSAGGSLLSSWRGVVGAGENPVYTFDFDIPATLDYVGTVVLRFRYAPKIGKDVHLDYYDSVTDQLFAPGESLNFTVNTGLQAKLSSEPKVDTLTYGSDLHFALQVTDSVSGKSVLPGVYGNVFLTLDHVNADGVSFESDHVAATFEQGNYAIDWNVNPNAVRGKAVLGLKVSDADGTPHLLTRAGSDKAVFYETSVDGKIDVKISSTSAADHSSIDTAFVAEFVLVSQDGEQLSGADLNCVISHGGEQVAESLVASNPNGVYSVSWTLPRKKTNSGDYKLHLYRHVDRVMAHYVNSQAEKAWRQERHEKEQRGDAVDDSDVGPAPVAIPPFLVATHRHSAPIQNFLPVRTEFILTLALLALSVLVIRHYRK